MFLILVTSPHDDHEGVWKTYNSLVCPNQLRKMLASSGTFITFVTSGLAGAVAALVAVALNAPGPVVAVVTAGAGLSFVVIFLMLRWRQYRRITGRPVLFPAPRPPLHRRPVARGETGLESPGQLAF